MLYKLFIESFIIGLYSFIISLFFKDFSLQNVFIIGFIIGFIKHFLSGSLGIHNYYCKTNFNIIGDYPCNLLIFESILEGIVFILLFLLLKPNNMFIIGFTLHILCEIIGIHKYFCLFHRK